MRQICFSLNAMNGSSDMSTIAFRAKVTETSGSHPLTFIGANLGCMVSEMRTYCPGVEVERMQFQNRLETILQQFLP